MKLLYVALATFYASSLQQIVKMYLPVYSYATFVAVQKAAWYI